MMNRFFTLLLSASCLTAVGQVPDYVPTNGLVAWYPFNGDAADFSGNGHHGTVDGAGSAPDRNGLLDQSLFFDGVNDGVFIPHHDDFLTADQTVTFWINIEASELNDTPGASNSMGLVNKTNQETSNTQNRFFAIILDGVGEPSYEPYKVTLAASTGQSVNPGSSVESASTDTMFYSDHWFFIAAAMTENSLEIYVDGEIVASSVLLYTRLPNTADIKIGVDYKFDPNRYFNGRLDDVGFWNRALSSEEILELYMAPPPVMGCMDPEACNFDPEANFENGSCHFNCQFCLTGTVWSEELGGCIGDGSGDINLDGCVQLNDLLDLLSAYGDCGAEESPWQCGDALEYQGYDYETVQIGEQCWFAENLTAYSFANGDPIPNGDEIYQSWPTLTTPGLGFPEFDISFKPLYNFFVVDDPRGVCPHGWVVPEISQFPDLTSWPDVSLPGYLNADPFNSLFLGQNEVEFFWSRTQTSDGRGFAADVSWDFATEFGINHHDLNFGFSIRCLKNAE